VTGQTKKLFSADVARTEFVREASSVFHQSADTVID